MTEQNKGIESFYTLQGEKIFISTGNLGQKLSPASYALKYDRMSGSVYMRPSAVATTDDTTLTEQMQEIISVGENFIKGVQNNSIEELGYKTKFGLLLEGPPGTGKSQTVNVVADSFINSGGIVVGISDIEVVDDGGGDFLKRVNEIQPDMPILCILEDIDGYDDYYERVLTSFLDGEQSPKNILFMGTTNFCSEVSERLKRPGRFDIIYTVEGMTDSVRKTYIKSKLKQFNKKVTAAEMKEYMKVTKEYNFAELRTFMAYIGIFGFDVKNIAAKLARGESFE